MVERGCISACTEEGQVKSVRALAWKDVELSYDLLIGTPKLPIQDRNLLLARASKFGALHCVTGWRDNYRGLPRTHHSFMPL